MLEPRSAYGYCGVAGGVTGENVPRNYKSARLPYREYKTRWADHKTVYGSYDKETKTIEVIFTADEMKAKTNLGNRYKMDTYFFLFDGVEKGYLPASEFTAKTHENAVRNAKAWAKKKGYTVVREITFAEYRDRNW